MDKNGIKWRIEVNEELQKLEIYAEREIPRKDFPQIKCGASRHIVHLDENGLSTFNKNFLKENFNG